jgi:hypothetical protein
MLKRLQKKSDDYSMSFKEIIKNKMKEMEMTQTTKGSNLLQFIYDYENLQFTKEDFQKRKRVKNNVPLCDRCMALKAGGKRCTRRHKGQNLFCGTHLKGSPHGVVNNQEKTKKEFEAIQICAEEIKGIVCHLDAMGNIYDPQDIHQNIKNPKVIAQYTKDLEGNYTIIM